MGENVALALTESIKKCGLSSDHLSCCITDNGSNFVKATTILNWPRLLCFSHNLHLAITNTIKDDTRRVLSTGGVGGKVLPQTQYLPPTKF